MPLDLHGFVTPQDNYEGLYKVADDIDKRNQRVAQAKQQKATTQASNAKFLTEYLNPKDHLTGTVYDPEVNKGFNGILGQALQMSTQGMPLDQITMAINPMVNQLSSYSSKAKIINDNITKQIGDIPADSGYLKEPLRQKALQSAFLDENGQIKDINTVDEKNDWLKEATKRYPSDVTDNSGLIKFINGESSKTQPISIEGKYTNSRGGSTKTKFETHAPNWMVLDTDSKGNNTNQLVPKFDLATDDKNPIIHPDSKEPIRLVDNGVYHFIMGNNPSYADRIRGEVQQHLKSGDYTNPDGTPIDINSEQATNVAKGLVYNDLNMLSPKGLKKIEEQKVAPAPRTTINNNIHNGTNSDTNYGNDFDNLGNYQYPGGAKIEGGIMYNADNSKKTGKVAVPVTAIPATLEASLMSLDKGNRLKVNDGFVTVDMVDGVPQSIDTVKGYTFKRNANVVGQQNIGKGAKFEGNKPFGVRGKESKNKPVVNSKNDPLGIH